MLSRSSNNHDVLDTHYVPCIVLAVLHIILVFSTTLWCTCYILSSFYTGANRLKAIVQGHIDSNSQSWTCSPKFGLHCSASRFLRMGLSICPHSAFKPPPNNKCLYDLIFLSSLLCHRAEEKITIRRNEWWRQGNADSIPK